jgi:hypothetical protein
MGTLQTTTPLKATNMDPKVFASALQKNANLKIRNDQLQELIADDKSKFVGQLLQIDELKSQIAELESTASSITPTESATSTPVQQGVKARPIDISISISEFATDEALFIVIQKELKDKYPAGEFSLVIIYAGVGGDRSEQATRAATARASKIGDQLGNWSRFTREQYVLPSILLSGRVDQYQLKIFPIVNG